MAVFNIAEDFHKQNQAEYYIHRHAKDFYGSNSSVINIFNRAKVDAYNSMKSRYQTHFKASINPKSWEMLEAAMGGEGKEEEIISTIETEVFKSLQKAIDPYAEGSDSYILLDALRTARGVKIEDLLSENNLEYLNTLFDAVEKATNLIEEGERKIGGDTLAAILNEFLKQGPHQGDLPRLSRRLSRKALEMNRKREILTVSEETIRSITASLAGLTKRIKKNVLKRGSLDSYLSNIFSTKVGEYIVSKGILAGAADLNEALKRSLAGAGNVKFTADDLELAQQFGQRGSTKFKTDNKFDNFSVEIEELGNKEINFNLGLSTKWYTGDFNQPNFSISLGGEKSFENKLTQTLAQANINKYYAYNAIALKNQNSEGYNALMQLIIARNLDVFMSGIGVGGDFSQFLVINGVFFSMYEIINKYMILLDDLIQINLGGAADAIARETDEAAKEEQPSRIKAYLRAKKQNQEFANVGMSIHLYPNKLRNAIS